MIFALVDFETTGLTNHFEADISTQPKAIEFGCLLTDGEVIVDELNIIINPQQELEEIITKITGITQDQVDEALPFAAQTAPIKRFLSKAGAAIAHNMAFDRAIMELDCRRSGLTMADIGWPRREFCTVELTKPFYGRRMKLEELYNMHVGPIVQSHRAIDDCKMLFEVCKVLEVFKCLR